ncbi:MAG: Co2+/Mg2+ efflux protein ApaG [Pseudomonadota bacterium]
MFEAVTRDISVNVMPVYIDERSDPDSSRYFWAYRVHISNNSGEAVQIMSRYWKITDANGHVEEVRGDGVVGEQPLIEPGNDYAYTSGCPLMAPSGIMVGSYLVESETGERFEIDIPAFPLDLPDLKPSLN